MPSVILWLHLLLVTIRGCLHLHLWWLLCRLVVTFPAFMGLVDNTFESWWGREDCGRRLIGFLLPILLVLLVVVRLTVLRFGRVRLGQLRFVRRIVKRSLQNNITEHARFAGPRDTGRGNTWNAQNARKGITGRQGQTWRHHAERGGHADGIPAVGATASLVLLSAADQLPILP